MSLDKFMKDNEPKGRGASQKLAQYKDDVKKLYENGYSNSQIFEYLKSLGVKISNVTVSKYIRDNFKEEEKQEEK